MNCLYCDREIKRITFYSLLETDLLCPECRKKMVKRHVTLLVDELETEIFYDYDSLFRSLLLQYKECYDEALKEVFLYGIADYLKIRYHGYSILYVPSTKKKLEERGFNHLKGIYESLGLKEVEGLSLIDEQVQEGKNKKEREKMQNNYHYEGNREKKVLIVDDVLTTGSSLLGVYKAMKPYCEEVKAISLAIRMPKEKKSEIRKKAFVSRNAMKSLRY